MSTKDLTQSQVDSISIAILIISILLCRSSCFVFIRVKFAVAKRKPQRRRPAPVVQRAERAPLDRWPELGVRPSAVRRATGPRTWKKSAMMIEAGEIGHRARRAALAALRLRRIHRGPRAARRAGARRPATCRSPAGTTAPAISSACRRCGGRRCPSRCCIRSRRIGRSSKRAAAWPGRSKNSASRRWRRRLWRRSSNSIRPTRSTLRAMLDELRSGGAPVVDLLPKFPRRRAHVARVSPRLANSRLGETRLRAATRPAQTRRSAAGGRRPFPRNSSPVAGGWPQWPKMPSARYADSSAGPMPGEWHVTSTNARFSAVSSPHNCSSGNRCSPIFHGSPFGPWP